MRTEYEPFNPSVSYETLLTSKVKEEIFEVLKLRHQIAVSREHLNLHFDNANFREHLVEELVMQMDYYVMGHQKEVSEKVPLTWWDHLKFEHAPEWFLERYPVKFRKITFRAEEIFPKRKLTREEIGRGCVHFQQIE